MALLSNASLDVASATFRPAQADYVGLSRDDVNGDGIEDLIARFRVRNTGIAVGDTEACLVVTTEAGNTFQGCDSIVVVK